MWSLSFYGLPIVHPDSLFVIRINGTGFFIQLIYVSIFFIYSPVQKRVSNIKISCKLITPDMFNWLTFFLNFQQKITIALLVEAIFFAIVVFITVHFYHTPKDRSMIIGILCMFFNIIMYASPLTVIVGTTTFIYFYFYYVYFGYFDLSLKFWTSIYIVFFFGCW